LVKIGREGKYMSIDKGPKADSDPKTMAIHNRRDCETIEEETTKSF